MPSSMRNHHFWRYLNKLRGTSASTTLTRIQRRALDLMSIASVLAFFAVLAWLLAAWALSQAAGINASGASSVQITLEISSAQRLLERWHMMPNRPFDAAALALAWLLAFVATMAPIVCLRRLGKALYVEAPLSFVVARRFLGLGHALVANIVIGFVAARIVASQITEYQSTFGLGFWGTVVAVILAYVMADIVREGARATEENREFV